MNKYCRLLKQSTGTGQSVRDRAASCKEEPQWPGRNQSTSYFGMTTLMGPEFRNTRTIRIWLKTTYIRLLLPNRIKSLSFKQFVSPPMLWSWQLDCVSWAGPVSAPSCLSLSFAPTAYALIS